VESEWLADFCAVRESRCGEDATATGTLHQAREASTNAAMNLFFFFFMPKPVFKFLDLPRLRGLVCDCTHKVE
jgi:hypothetical protein